MKASASKIIVSAFIKKDNKYLLVFDPRFDFWRVVGGRLKHEEKIEEALKREIKEELGVEVEITNFLGFGQDNVMLVKQKRSVSRVLLYFECKIKKGEIKILAPDEISDMKWLSLSEIKNHQNLEPGMLASLKRLK